MKRLLIIAALFSLLFTCCEVVKINPSTIDKPFKFISEDTITGKKDYLYVKAHEWMAKTFVSSKEVIQMNDKEAGKIIGKGTITTHTTYDGLGIRRGNDITYYTIQIDVKDGKFRCKLTDFIHEGGTWIYSGTYGSHAVNSKSFGDLDTDFDKNSNNDYYRFLEVKWLVQTKAKSILRDFNKAMRDKTDTF